MSVALNFEDLTGLPSNMNFVRGVDVSHHNQLITWRDIVNEGCEFAYIKTTDGVRTLDTTAKIIASNAKEAGLKIGYYHLARPDTRNGGSVTADAKSEAREFYNAVASLPDYDLPPAIDFEDVPSEGWDSRLTPGDYRLWINTFYDELYPLLQINQKLILYSRKKYFEDHLLDGSRMKDKFSLWLSRYSADYHDSETIKFWNEWDLWQFSQSGLFNHNSPLDLNIWKRDKYEQALIDTPL